MGIIFNFGDDAEKMQSGENISFNNLDFIIDQLGNLHLEEPESPEQEEEQPPPVRAFITGLEEAVDGGPLTLSRHLTRHGRVFAETGREHKLDVTFQI